MSDLIDEKMLSDRQGTHADGCADWGPAHYECAIRERDELRRQLDEARAERDEHARWREKLADDLHERESQIIDGWAALRDSGVQSEKNIADGIKLLRAENEALAADARRYRWLRGDACPDHSVRWTQWEVRCWVAPFWSGDLRREGLDRSIDAARAAEQSERRGK